MGKTQEQNQNGNELALQWGAGRKGVEKMLATMSGELRTIAAPNVAGESFDVWKMRAFVEVVNNDALREVIQQPHGILSIYQGLSKAAVMGLQIGGQFPHAYFVPKAGRAVMMPTKDGYLFTATYGPGAVLAKLPELQKVYEKDEFRLDDAARTYEHTYKPFADRGKRVGYFMVLEYKDGRKIIRHILQSKVEAIEKAYGAVNGQAYKNSPDEMDEKTAIKWLLRDVVRESEGLAMLDSLDAEQPDASADPPMRDVTERTVARLERAAESVGPGTETEPTKQEPEAGEQKPAQAAAAQAGETKELF